MDDMFSGLEREDARIYDIQKHPEYRSHFEDEFQINEIEDGIHFDLPPDVFIDGEMDASMDPVDAEMIKILEEVGAAKAHEEKNAIGNNVCWQCTHRQDPRPLWKRILFSPNEISYLCGATKRTEVVDPVSGQVRWIERVQDMFGPQLALVNTPHRTCVEVNPSGRCKMFNIAMAKRKKRRKE